MSEHNGQRLTLIGIILLVALAIIFSPVIHKLTHPHEKIASLFNLKPGIDIVGGTSLLYEIKVPEGTKPNGHLASDVAEVLKKRVDPEGVRNLIWRPQGDTRLEIQMPMSGDSQENADKRKELSREMVAAQDALEQTNVTADEVIDAIEGKNGKTRADLDRLASDSQTRKELFHKAAQLWDDIQKAHQAQNADEEARLRIEYNNLLHPKAKAGELAARPPIQATNLQPEELDSILTEPEQDRAKDLDNLKKQFANFPARQKAIDDYVAAYDAVKSSRGALDDVTDLKRKLKGAGVLEFHMLADDMPADEYQKMVQRLQTDGPKLQAGDTARWFEVDNPKQFHHQTYEYNKKHYVLAWITPDKSLDNRPGVRHWALKDARIETQQTGEQVVGFAFDPQGGKYFGDLTGNPNNLHKPMAIVLDGRVISAPNINSKISESGIIEGGENGFTAEELDYLVSTLRAGSLPAQLADEPISEKTVGPQLGQDNLRAGLLACWAGLAVVAVFLIGYYYIAGVVAFFAVVMNVLLILAVMSAMNATFTLPSIAGIVLTIGTAVDANVLVFERLREEQLHGVGIRLALRHAYEKAASAIWDSNMTTLITSAFLILLGTEEVRGFGVTLIIGIVASLFTALFVTRTIFNIMVEKFGVKTLGSIPMTFPKWDKLLRPNIDWMKMAWAFITFSVVVTVVGLVLFTMKVKQGKMFDIEFAGGTSVTFELKSKMQIDEVRHLLETKGDPNALPSPQPQSVGNNDLTYEVSTPNPDSVQVKDAILKAMRGPDGASLLKVDVPSTFDNAGKAFGEAMNAAVLPLNEQNVNALANGDWAGGFKVPAVRNDKGGVAILLNHLNPGLSGPQIADRIHQQQFQLGSNDPGAREEFTVETPYGPNSDRPTTVAVVLTSNDTIPYMKDAEKWQEQVAGPLWTLTNEGINRPAQLQQVKTFDAQVAGDTTSDAIKALVFSILVIMAYIWFRFGNLKYGTATVVALIHDALFVLAALGIAHYLVNVPVLKSIFQLEPFRINMTVVAGILTIMGYSMIDTIVVFDRIRENRGKYGHVSRKIVNDAINQTLSRTLLTAGTNIVTVAIMYFLGGEGIHGFTFVLLVGILVGTYSSIMIASPMLLLGKKIEHEAVGGRPAGRLQQAGA